MDKFIALVVSGAVSGAIYSLLASGLVLTYSTSGIFNFGHGAVAFTTAFLFFELNSGLGWPPLLAGFVAVFLFAPLLGVALDRLVFRPLASATEVAKIVATVGVLVALPNLALWIVELLVNTFDFDLPKGDNIVTAPGIGPVPKTTWNVTDFLTIDSNQLIVLVGGAVAAGALWFVVQRTSLGLRLRATVERSSLARLRGVDTVRASRTAWIMSFFLAGLAGVLSAPLISLTPVSYTGILFIAATAAVLGRLRSIPLAFLGGLAIGVAQSLFSGYATFAEGITGLSTAVPFIVLYLGLFVLGRERGRVAGTVADSTAPPDYLGDLPHWRRILPWGVATAVFVVWLTFIGDDTWTSLAVRGLAYGIIFLSFVVVTGIGGMVSLAQAAFVSISALTTGLLLSHGVPFLPALAIGVAAAVVAGIIVALPAVRLGSLELALSSLALALVGDRVLFAWKSFSNAEWGWRVERPDLGFIDVSDDRVFGLVLLGVIGLLILGIRNLRRSATGRSMMAVRASKPAAAAVGLSPMRSKLMVFAISAAIAGLGGVLLATLNQSVTNRSTPAEVGMTWLAVVVLFGIRRPGAAILAGMMFALSGKVLGYVTDSSYIPLILFGLGAIQLARTPDGTLEVFGGLTHARRRKRAEAAEAAALADTDAVRADAEPPPPPPLAPPVVVASDRPAGPAALAVSGLHAGYDGVEVLHGVDLEAHAGRITVLLGANGAGKSTLCGAITGVVSQVSGQVHLADADISGVPAHRRSRQGMSFAPESRGIFPGLTVEENLTLTLPAAADREAAYARFPSLAARRGIEASYLSGGEQQMLALAPVTVHAPAVFIADEPSLGLGPLIVEEIMGVFRELRDRGTAVLLVEEKASHALAVADDVLFLQLGRITWSGPADQLDEEELAASYLHTT
jgi:ABC-type branched-subunit amino acid transport system ATPase component/branched-subunit amino acid ABC-type transport system permease component